MAPSQRESCFISVRLIFRLKSVPCVFAHAIVIHVTITTCSSRSFLFLGLLHLSHGCPVFFVPFLVFIWLPQFPVPANRTRCALFLSKLENKTQTKCVFPSCKMPGLATTIPRPGSFQVHMCFPFSGGRDSQLFELMCFLFLS